MSATLERLFADSREECADLGGGSRITFEPELVVVNGALYAAVGGNIVANLPSQVAHPLAPPTLSGTLITVDTMLNQPTRITRMIMDMTLQRFVADRIYTSSGGVSGGAVVYDSVEANDLYTSRDVERVA